LCLTDKIRRQIKEQGMQPATYFGGGEQWKFFGGRGQRANWEGQGQLPLHVIVFSQYASDQSI